MVYVDISSTFSHNTLMKPSFIFFTSLILCFNSIQGQGKLEKAEESLTKKERANYNNSRSYDDDDYDDDSVLADTFGSLIVDLVLYLSYYTIVETPIENEYRASNASITRYPYLNSKKGNYAYDWGDDTKPFRATLSNRYISENNKLYGNHLNLNMRFLKRAGLEVDYLQLWEENTNFGNNTLAIYSAIGKYHRIRTERFDAWWGLGATYVDGAVDEFGFTYALGAEWFFVKPFSLEANFNQTFINDNTVNKLPVILNYHVNRYKFSGGYQYLKIGSQSFSTFFAGIGISF